MSQNAEKLVENGFVLGRNGQWITLDAAIAQEEQLCDNLRKGLVFRQQQWITLDEAISTGHAESGHTNPDALLQTMRLTANSLFDQETKVISIDDLDNLGFSPQSAGYNGNEELDIMRLVEQEISSASQPDILPRHEAPETVRMLVDGETCSSEKSTNEEYFLEPISLSDDDIQQEARAQKGRRMFMSILSVAAGVILVGTIALIWFLRGW